MNNHKVWTGATITLLLVFTASSFITSSKSTKKLDNINPYKKFTSKPVKIKQVTDPDILAKDVVSLNGAGMNQYLSSQSKPDRDLARYIKE